MAEPRRFALKEKYGGENSLMIRSAWACMATIVLWGACAQNGEMPVQNYSIVKVGDVSITDENLSAYIADLPNFLRAEDEDLSRSIL